MMNNIQVLFKDRKSRVIFNMITKLEKVSEVFERGLFCKV